MDVSVDIDTDEFEEKLKNELEKQAVEYLEDELQEGHFECECGSELFDIETWKDNSGEYKAGAVCRECNKKVDIEIDTSDFN